MIYNKFHVAFGSFCKVVGEIPTYMMKFESLLATAGDLKTVDAEERPQPSSSVDSGRCTEGTSTGHQRGWRV